MAIESLHASSEEVSEDPKDQKIKSLEEQKEALMGLIGRLDGRLQSEHDKSNEDELTGLPNRRAFIDRFTEETAVKPGPEGTERRGQRHEQNEPKTFLYVDIDRFKNINDTYGHDVGDLVLQRVADFLKNITRPGDFPARYGGEEFAVLLKNVTPETFIERIGGNKEKKEGPVEGELYFDMDIPGLGNEIKTIPLRVSMSGGAVKILPGAQFEKIIKKADDLLYEAKRRGRNRILLESGEAEK